MATETVQTLVGMSSHHELDKPHEVASKVLRRAQVSKMTRVLQDRLALANIKIKHGWQDRSLNSIEPEIERELKRKRIDSNLDVFSDTSSTVSGRGFSNDIPSSSPLTAPVFSDEIGRSGSSCGSTAKRLRRDAGWRQLESGSQTQRRPRAERPSLRSWKSAYQLPQSSPISYQRQIRHATLPKASFVSHSSTITESPSASEDDDQDLPLHSFQMSNTNLASSPPKTPPPEVARSARLRSKAFTSPLAETTVHGGREGADLLLYLAASPSPAMRGNKGEMFPPSTPPARNTPLPSSMMSTPGGQLLYEFAPNTPSNGFNFADFVNITPSPAQGPWSKTPGTIKTPAANREARRRLNYDGLMPPPSHSPNIGSISRSVGRKGAGLGMELGGELLS